MLTSWTKRNRSLPEFYAKFVAIDGFSFAAVAKSKGIRIGLLSLKLDENIPSHPATIKSMVMRYAESIKVKNKVFIKELLQKNARFGLTFDEWTSTNSTRFFNLTLHYSDSQIINLGLFKVTGKATSKNLLALIKKSLEHFEIDFEKHIVGIMTDGCRTMKKLGEDAASVLQQLCFAHAIQLAVLDVLYQKKNFKKDNEWLSHDESGDDWDQQKDDNEKNDETAESTNQESDEDTDEENDEEDYCDSDDEPENDLTLNSGFFVELYRMCLLLYNPLHCKGDLNDK